jgi:hypothetical protein
MPRLCVGTYGVGGVVPIGIWRFRPPHKARLTFESSLGVIARKWAQPELLLVRFLVAFPKFIAMYSTT